MVDFARDGSPSVVYLQVADVQGMQWQINTDINAVFDLILQVLPSPYQISHDIVEAATSIALCCVF